ncbi:MULTISPECIES: P-loop NTPase fold protein [Cyanophyceae]|uniref:P-loop NTPase fold protein n=1 Tax=Cyanophyceae TaxID=3028117 RepID=UPI0016860605|nr:MULTISPECIES: P-loop NTPase fold protein [Cyanophyceae]MBD1914665.1 hypothetical protein [Phormidium sp. FACHB-77]MBD2032553.1 hypothetical protein [Phormidium sp. FACHB-322]MBD2049411.1 hypothetical protein [Leptolyngbya sp. FACHB-60]
MASNNKHIEDYLNYYFDSEFDANFAVMLSGGWGTGKTWFIKEYYKDFEESRKEKGRKVRFVYVSLNGLTSFAEIEDQIFGQLHPFRASKGFVLANKFFKSFLRSSIRLDLDFDKDSKNDASINLATLEAIFDGASEKSSDYFIIFDDLERCRIEIEAILGYINLLVEHQKVKSVLIANENEIGERTIAPESLCKIDSSRYRQIKEKVVGKSFQISINLEHVTDVFINNVKDEILKKYLTEKKNLILNIFEMSGDKNLRFIQHSLWDFERLFLQGLNCFSAKEELLDDVLMTFLALFFEVRSGRITPEDIRDVEMFTFRSYQKSKNEKTADVRPIDSCIDKYSFLRYKYSILGVDNWIHFLKNGYLEKESILSVIGKSEHFAEENTEKWIQLYHYRDIEDDRFIDLLNSVNKDWTNRAYKIPPEIIHVSGIFIRLSELGLFWKRFDWIIADSKSYIDYLDEQGILKNYSDMNLSDNWGNLIFAAHETSQFKEIFSYFKEKLSNAAKAKLSEEASELLGTLIENPSKFWRKVSLGHMYDSSEIQEKQYHNIPILAEVNPRKFVDAVLSVRNKDKLLVGYSIKDRYNFQSSPDSYELVSELDFLREVKSILIQEYENRLNKPSGYNLKLIVEEYLEPAINKLEEIANLLRQSS